MLGASLIFALLSQFYYEYVPEDLFLDDGKKDIADDEALEKGEIGLENVALEDNENAEAEL